MFKLSLKSICFNCVHESLMDSNGVKLCTQIIYGIEKNVKIVTTHNSNIKQKVYINRIFSGRRVTIAVIHVMFKILRIHLTILISVSDFKYAITLVNQMVPQSVVFASVLFTNYHWGIFRIWRQIREKILNTIKWFAFLNFCYLNRCLHFVIGLSLCRYSSVLQVLFQRNS